MDYKLLGLSAVALGMAVVVVSQLGPPVASSVLIQVPAILRLEDNALWRLNMLNHLFFADRSLKWVCLTGPGATWPAGSNPSWLHTTQVLFDGGSWSLFKTWDWYLDLCIRWGFLSPITLRVFWRDGTGLLDGNVCEGSAGWRPAELIHAVTRVITAIIIRDRRMGIHKPYHEASV